MILEEKNLQKEVTSKVHLQEAIKCIFCSGVHVFKGVLWGIALLSWTLLVLKYNYSPSADSDYFLRLLDGPLNYDDPQLLAYIKTNILDSPSTQPYNLDVGSRGRYHASEMFYAHFSEKLFATKRNGFFVEAGALDGQAMSNTLSLEMKLGWTGLLVEPDPANYISLKKKNRKVWSTKACLSIAGYPKKERLSSVYVLKQPGIGHGRGRAMGGIVKQLKNKTFSSKGPQKDESTISYYTSQCFPLESFLLALNVTRVDLLSLDVEHFEREIISNFDFERFDIQVVYMEWWDLDRLAWLNDFMQNKGFYFVMNIMADIIYVKENSEFKRLVDEKHLRGNFTLYQIMD